RRGHRSRALTGGAADAVGGAGEARVTALVGAHHAVAADAGDRERVADVRAPERDRARDEAAGEADAAADDQLRVGGAEVLPDVAVAGDAHLRPAHEPLDLTRLGA